jgi:hypothetical protein
VGKVTVDSREKDAAILALADDRRLLEYVGTNGEAFSYDLHIECDDGTVVRVERKALLDARSSMFHGDMDRQVAAVDVLVVEADPFDDFEEMDVLREHLCTLSMNLPVIYRKGPSDTMAFAHRIAKRGGVSVRPNNVRVKSPTWRRKFLSTLPGINPERPVADGYTLGDYLESIIDWKQIADALNLDVIDDALPTGTRKVGPATRRRIEDAVLGATTRMGEP